MAPALGIESILAQLAGVKRTGEGFVARCPSHEDHRQSLSVSEGRDGRILLHCHAGCETEAVCGALGITPADLFADEPRSNGGGRKVVATYDYVDEAGVPLYQVVRFEPKDFRQRRLIAGEWSWKLGDVRRAPYRLPEVIAATQAGREVYIVEGEKDVHALEAAGAVATCNAGGAGKWRPEWAAYFAGAHVVIVADKDAPGRAHADAVAASVTPVAASVRIVEAAAGKDAADHLAAGYGPGEFVEVSASGAAEQEAPPLVTYIDWKTFWDEDDDENEWVYKDVLARGRGHAIYATHKSGKSLFSLHMAAEVATAGHACLYLDYEMTPHDVRERLKDMGYGPHSDLSHLHYALLPSLPALDSEKGGQALAGIADGIIAGDPGRHLVVVIDTISRAVWGEENSADTWRLFYVHTGLRLKQRGVTWLRLDHGGKDSSKGQRGSSGKGDDVDVVWKLERADGGVLLRRELARMSWVPEFVTLAMRDFPLTYSQAEETWPAGTRELANILDRLEVPVGASVRVAGLRLREINEGRRHELVAAALRWRRGACETASGTAENGRGTPRGTAENGRGTPRGTPVFEGSGNSGEHTGEQTVFSFGNSLGNSGEQCADVSGEQCTPSIGVHVSHVAGTDPNGDEDIPW